MKENNTAVVPAEVTSLTQAIRNILSTAQGATVKSVQEAIKANYPLVKSDYRPIFGVMRRLANAPVKVATAPKAKAEKTEKKVEAPVATAPAKPKRVRPSRSKAAIAARAAAKAAADAAIHAEIHDEITAAEL